MIDELANMKKHARQDVESKYLGPCALFFYGGVSAGIQQFYAGHHVILFYNPELRQFSSFFRMSFWPVGKLVMVIMY